jgi:hypothetical protein
MMQFAGGMFKLFKRSMPSPEMPMTDHNYTIYAWQQEIINKQ